MGVTDEQLIDLLKKGDQKAFEEIYSRYWYRLYKIAFYEIGTREEAEELVHDVFEDLWNKRTTSSIRHVGAYLTVSVKHRITDYIKSCITQRKYREYIILQALQQSNATDETVHYSDLTRLVEDTLKNLPEKTSEVFRLSRFENQSIKDIAKKLNLSEKGVEYHLTQSLKVLKQHLKVYHSDN